MDVQRAEVERVFALQSEYKWTAKTSSVAERKDHLRQLRSELLARGADIEEAVISDLPQPRTPGRPREVAWSCTVIDQTLEHLDEWVRPESWEPSAWLPGTRPSVEYEARGVCLVFGPWNVPFHLSIEPTVAALAAGNTVIVKPNSLTPATAEVVAEVIGKVFDARLVAAFGGGDDVARLLLDQPVDHIFFTGSPAVGKIVMLAAAQHLSTVTLELGGKCPAIVDGTHDLADTARLVGEGRHVHGGQICFAVDHVWVQRGVAEAFVGEYDSWIEANLGVDAAADPSAATPIINQRNVDRVMGLIEDARSRGARVVRGGRLVAGQARLIEPTIILDAPPDSRVMTEEIFGPVLPIQTFDDTTDLLLRVRSAPKPLAMYVFSDDDNFVSTVLAGTSSGGVTVNGFGTHVSEPKVGFGGVNNSGSGRYHGVWGFREFSNPRAVVRHDVSS
ncbi:MAG TPA: aldehyde dehydrogenase family protein [Microlunatus sp.]|nr:aldehyde dehydrogenase family protein [Microlunatus sp.]